MMGSDPIEVPSKEKCGVLQKEITEFWDNSARGYGLYTRIVLKNPGAIQSELERCIPGNRKLKILDAGTGAGLIAVLLAKTGHDVVAMDVSKSMLEEARWIADSNEVRVDFVEGNATSTGFPDESFDVIVARNLMFTLPYPGYAYLEWIRLLRPGGRLVVMDGNYYFQIRLEEYAKRDRFMHLKYGMEEIAFLKEMGNIDYTSLGQLAVRLYSNKVRRPSWDLWYLTYSGVNDISVRCTDTEEFRTYTDYGPTRIPIRYTMCARKPFFSESAEPGEILEPAEISEKALPVLEAISNPYRYKIVRTLMRGPANNSALSKSTGVKWNLLSYHLNLLRNAGIITNEKRGRNVFYSLEDRDALENIINSAESMTPLEQEKEGQE